MANESRGEARPESGEPAAVLLTDRAGDKPRSVPIKEHEKPIRPNMLAVNAEAQSSTFAGVNFSHCVFTQSATFNSRFHASNFEGCAYDSCDFDGAIFSGCSFRGVELVNCDIDHLVVNGINVGHLLKLLMGEMGGIR